MTKRIVLLLPLFALVFGADHALAGGYATIKVVSLPREPVAGRPFDLEFVVLQNGVRPMSDLKPTVVASCGGHTLQLAASPAHAAGHYTAAVTLPRAGRWAIRVESNFCGNRLSLPALKVGEARSAAAR